MLKFFKSKTVWAGVLSAVGYVLNHAGPVDAPTVVQAAGMILGAVGVKDAIAKVSGTNQG